MQSANPGGEHRNLIKHTIKDWIDAQEIDGIGLVWPSMRPDLEFDQDSNPVTDCIVRINLPDTAEDRLAYTGPTDPGGKLEHYQVELHLHHVGYDLDEWDTIERDYDRIVDALKDALRGRGRDLGHPDVVLSLGEYPRQGNIRDTHDDPTIGAESDGTPVGPVERRGTIFFEVSHYLQSPGEG